MRLPQFIEAKVQCNDLGKVPLVFDIIGPLVAQFQQGDDYHAGSAIICAPLCVDHHANLLTDSDDVSVKGLSAPAPNGGFVYHFLKDHAPTGARWYLPPPPRPHSIFRVKYTKDDPVYTLDAPTIARKCYATFHVPMPNRIVALRPEFGWVHRNGADPDLWVIDKDQAIDAPAGCAASADDIICSPRGRGLRFIYNECKVPPDFLLGEDGPANLCAETKGFSPTLSPYYSITLRFAAAHATGDGIDDAHTCFQNMRALFDTKYQPSEFSKWRTDFAHLPGSGSQPSQMLLQVGGPNPRDCGAMVLAMQDWNDSDVPQNGSSEHSEKKYNPLQTRRE
jgi:hypothetical protein